MVMKNKTYSANKGNNLKTIRLIFLSFDCMIALLIGAISLGNIAYDTLKMNKPEFYMSEYQKMTYINNEKYILQTNLQDDTGKLRRNYTNDDITKMRKEEYIFTIQSVEREAEKSIISYTIALVLSIVIFFVHWKILKKLQED